MSAIEFNFLMRHDYSLAFMPRSRARENRDRPVRCSVCGKTGGTMRKSGTGYICSRCYEEQKHRR